MTDPAAFYINKEGELTTNDPNLFCFKPLYHLKKTLKIKGSLILTPDNWFTMLIFTVEIDTLHIMCSFVYSIYFLQQFKVELFLHCHFSM